MRLSGCRVDGVHHSILRMSPVSVPLPGATIGRPAVQLLAQITKGDIEMTTQTTGATCCIAEIIVPGARMTLKLAQAMNADIPADKFARKPQGADTNHPAWAMGHLSLYGDLIVELVGRAELAAPNETFTELFKAETACRDDADGSLYPSKADIMARFLERMNTAIDAVGQADDAALSAVNESRLADRFPTTGAAANFLLGHHVMMHLGQVSAWRRMMGLGPCSIG